MPTVNPNILRWARETAGLTMEQAIEKLDINDARGVAAIDRLAALEAGAAAPTRPLLVKMATHYRRPLLTFYLADVPRRGDRGEDFRTLPEEIGQTEAALVDVVVRDIRARQSLVRATLVAADEAEALPFIGAFRRGQGVAAIVRSIEEILRFDRTAFRARGSLQEAFAYLRELAEQAGIFVLLVDNLGSWHTTINVEAFRGFALADSVAPFVAVNANDSGGAWSFTLLHELAHLWIGATGVSGGSAERDIEKFCNDVASEILVPEGELAGLDIGETMALVDAMRAISSFADRRNVSSTMIAYKLHRAGAFSFGKFQQLKNAYRQAFFAAREAEKERNADKEGGPTYHVVRKHRVGFALIRFVDRMMHEGNLSTTKAGKVLGVGPHNVYALLDQARPKHAV